MRQGDPPANMYVILEGAVRSLSLATEAWLTRSRFRGRRHRGEMSLMTAPTARHGDSYSGLRALEIEKRDIEALMNPTGRGRALRSDAGGAPAGARRGHPSRRAEGIQATDILARMKAFFARLLRSRGDGLRRTLQLR